MKNNEDLNEEEIYINYIIGLHEIAEENGIKTEKLTLDKVLTKLLEKLSNAEFKKNKEDIKKYTKEVQERIKGLTEK